MNGKKAGVVGLGTMGSNIAIVCARAGVETVVCEAGESLLEEGMGRVRAFLGAGVAKGKTSPGEREAILGRMPGTTEIEALSDCDIVIEAISEDRAAKSALFKKLDGILKKEAILATNTSTLSVTHMGAASGRPDRVIGTHFCLPAALNKLVEVAPGRATSEKTVAAAVSFLEGAGQVPVRVKDSPGFILNLFLVPFQNDCIRLVETGYATAQDIDTAIRLGLGQKIGPMRLLDIEGLDVFWSVARSLYGQLQDPRFFPPPLVEKMIDAGHLGTKAGRGFYAYKKAGVFGVAEPEPGDTAPRETGAGEASAEAVKKVGVLGLGTMGSGIAQVCATAGLEVFGVEMEESALEAGMGRVRKNLEGAVKRGKMEEEEKAEILSRIQGSTALRSLADCDLVIEAVVENLEVKLALFRELDARVKKEARFASNTSCLSVSAMAAQTTRPECTLGLHFFNPPYAMRLVEAVEAVQTSPETAEFGLAFCRRIGKTPVPVKDRPGFLVNRLLVPYLNQAVQAFDDGLASREDMDKAVHMALGHPMGPLTLLDLIGLDVQEFVSLSMANELGEGRFGPPPLLCRLTAAGWLGRKTGKGFYEHGER